MKQELYDSFSLSYGSLFIFQANVKFQKTLDNGYSGC